MLSHASAEPDAAPLYLAFAALHVAEPCLAFAVLCEAMPLLRYA
jgi:hypothetical protein